jgi:hypothetical protein
LCIYKIYIQQREKKKEGEQREKIVGEWIENVYISEVQAGQAKTLGRPGRPLKIDRPWPVYNVF